MKPVKMYKCDMWSNRYKCNSKCNSPFMKYYFIRKDIKDFESKCVNGIFRVNWIDFLLYDSLLKQIPFLKEIKNVRSS